LAISKRLLALGASAAIILAACGPGGTASQAPVTPSRSRIVFVYSARLSHQSGRSALGFEHH